MIVTNHSVFYSKERISEKWKFISLKVKVNIFQYNDITF
jgi:hypothetical protein